MGMYNHLLELKLRNLIEDERRRKSTQTEEQNEASFNFCRGVLVSMFILDLIPLSEFEQTFTEMFNYWERNNV